MTTPATSSSSSSSSSPAPAAAPAAGAPVRDYRYDPHFTWPERVPWSELGPDVVRAWGRADPANPQPEHLEAVGPTGSGKTHAIIALLQDRQRARDTGAVFIATKRADAIFTKLGWPVVDSYDQAVRKKYKQFIYWPQTGLMGTRRNEYLDRKINDLLEQLWRPEANVIVTFDEYGKIERLSGEARANAETYWREGRSHGISVVAMKQRPQGAMRDMHSESFWKIAFPPEDRGDLERWAELFGARRDWMPVFDDLDTERHEFLIRHSRTKEAYITWIDQPLRPAKVKRSTPSWFPGR